MLNLLKLLLWRKVSPGVFVRGAGFCKDRVEIHGRLFDVQYDFMDTKTVEIFSQTVRPVGAPAPISEEQRSQVVAAVKSDLERERLNCVVR